MAKILLTYVLGFCFVLTFSQNKKIDSLLHIVKTGKQDTNSYKANMKLGAFFQSTNPDTAIYFHTQAKLLAIHLKEDTRQGKAILETGWDNFIKGNFGNALALSMEALNIAEKANPKEQRTKILKADALGNIGSIYANQANFPKAQYYYFKALESVEELANKTAMANIYGNLGTIFSNLGNTKKALGYYSMALKIAEEQNDNFGIARHLGNIGLIYKEQSHYTEALNYYMRSLKIAEKHELKQVQSNMLRHIGNVFLLQNNFAKAKKYFEEALKISEELHANKSIAATHSSMATLYMKMGIAQSNTRKLNYKKAEEYLEKSLAISRDIGTLDLSASLELTFSELDSVKGNFKGALAHYKNYIVARDSITNAENAKKQIQQEMQYEFDKKTTADSIRNSESQRAENAKHSTEISHQRTLTYSGLGALLVMIVVAGFSIQAYRNKQKSNIEIAQQKLLVEEKQKEILDSIYYARRIQRALITNESYIRKNLQRLK